MCETREIVCVRGGIIILMDLRVLAKEEVLRLIVETRRLVTKMHDGDVKGLGYNI